MGMIVWLSKIDDEFNLVKMLEEGQKYTLANFKVLDLLKQENDRMKVDEAFFQKD